MELASAFPRWSLSLAGTPLLQALQNVMVWASMEITGVFLFVHCKIRAIHNWLYLSASRLYVLNFSLLVTLESQSCIGTTVEGWSFEILVAGKNIFIY